MEIDGEHRKQLGKLFQRNGLYKLGRDRNKASEWLNF